MTASDAELSTNVTSFAKELSNAEYDMSPTAARRTDAAAAAAGDRQAEIPQATRLDLLMRIPVTVKVVLGSASMPISELANLGQGALIPLDRKVGEAVDITVNGRVIARGEIVVLDEATSQFGVTLTEIGDIVGAG